MSNIDAEDLKKFNIELEKDLRRLHNKIPPPNKISETDIYIRHVCTFECLEVLFVSLSGIFCRVHGGFTKMVLEDYFITTQSYRDQVGNHLGNTNHIRPGR